MDFRKTNAKTTHFILIILLSAACLPDNRDHSKCAPGNDTDTEKKSPTMQVEHYSQNEKLNLAYTIKKGLAFTEGDIALGTKRQIENKAVGILGHPWKGNIFNYKINSKLSQTMHQKIASAIQDWTQRAGDTIQFIEVETADNYVEFIPADGCWSYVGMQGGRQEIGLDKDCSTAAATHEVGHALGLWHEQSRRDRDQFVEVKWCNIDEEERHNFLKAGINSKDLGVYDYRSIMHYTRGAFSINKYVTLQSKTNRSVPLLTVSHPSSTDSLAVKCLHNNQAACDELKAITAEQLSRENESLEREEEELLHKKH